MICPKCKGKTYVMDTRGERRVLRRRKCKDCGKLWFTLEEVIDYNEGLMRYQAHAYVKRHEKDKRHEDSENCS